MFFVFKNLWVVLIFSIWTYFVSQSTATGKFSLPIKKNNYLIYNFLCILFIYYFFLIITSTHSVSAYITSVLVFVISLVMYYVHEFRGTNVNFSDISSINTAKEVAGGYKYKIKPIFILFVLYFVFLLCGRIVINGRIVFDSGRHIKNVFTVAHFAFLDKLIEVFLFFLIFFILKHKISNNKYDYSLNAGEKEGYIYNFFSSIPIFHKKNANYAEIDRESNYFIYNVSSKNKLNNNNNFTNNSQINNYNINMPHIIVIMNESFGVAQNLVNTNIPVTPYFDNLSNVIKGNLYVNTFGGGTANTEFEFLTGMTIGNYDYPIMPYNTFVKRDKYSLARYFKNLGYTAKAFHPYTATNYHRDVVYKRFGFDKLLFFDDVRHKDYVRKFISDEAFYKDVISIYEDSIKNSEKLFLFGITMQNHSGYGDLKNIYAKSVDVNVKDKLELDSYLTLMNISDRALHILFDYFSKVKEEVIILFFGDHNASFGTDVNKAVYGNKLEYEFTNTYRTPFFIYNNKKKYNKYIDKTSANFLSLELIDSADLPLDEFHLLLKNVYKNYSSYNFHKAYERNDNVVYNIPNDSYMKLERKYLK